MTKFFLVLGATIFTAATVHAQYAEAPVKSELAVLHKEDKALRKAIKKDKKELRKLEGKEVSYQAKQAFYSDFGNMPGASWARHTYFDEVTFTNKDGESITAYYDYAAGLVGTTAHKTFSDLPLTAQKYINKKFGAYKKEDVIFFHDNLTNETDMLLYGSQFDDADNYFAALKKDNDEIIVRVDMTGAVSVFKRNHEAL